MVCTNRLVLQDARMSAYHPREQGLYYGMHSLYLHVEWENRMSQQLDLDVTVTLHVFAN